MTPEQDILAIQRLLGRYCVLVDKPDMEAFAELWTEDAEMQVGPAVWAGRDEVVARVGESVRGLHLAALPDLVVRGDEATGDQNFVFVAAASRELTLGRYEDEYRRTTAGWRFARRRVVFLGSDPT